MKDDKIFDGDIVISELSEDMAIETAPGVSLPYGKILLQYNKTRQSLSEKIEHCRALIADIGGENLKMSNEIKAHDAVISNLKEIEKEINDKLSQLRARSSELTDVSSELVSAKKLEDKLQSDKRSLEKRLKRLVVRKKRSSKIKRRSKRNCLSESGA